MLGLKQKVHWPGEGQTIAIISADLLNFKHSSKTESKINSNESGNWLFN